MDDEMNLEQAANFGRGAARPNEIRAMNSILKSGIKEQKNALINSYGDFQKNFGTNGEVNELLSSFAQQIKDVKDQMKALENSSKREDQLKAQQIKTTLKTLDIEKQLAKVQQDSIKTLKDVNRIQKSGARNAEDLADVMDNFGDLSDVIALCSDVLGDLYKNANGTSKALTQINERGQYIKTGQAEEKKFRKNELDLLKKVEKVLANQDAGKASAKEWSEIGRNLRSVVNTLNISQIASSFAPSSRQKIQQDIQTNYNIGAKEFQNFKQGLFNQVDTSIYTTEELVQAMGTLSSVTLNNTKTATENFKDLIRGQHVLGLSSQTQETLLRLNNVTGKNELKFYTNTVAKFQQSSLNLNKRQLDELVNLNASITEQAQDFGIATEAFDNMRTAESAAWESARPGSSAKYERLLKRALTDEDFAITTLGMSVGEVNNRLARGESFTSMLKSGPGVQPFLSNRDVGTLRELYQYAGSALGIDEDTFSVISTIAQNGTKLNKELVTASQALMDNTDAATKQEERYGSVLDVFQKGINWISNWWTGSMNWTEIEFLGHIDKMVTLIAASIGIKDVLGGAKQLMGLGGKIGSGKLALSSLKVGSATGGAALGAMGLGAGALALGAMDATKTASWQGGSLRGFFLGSGYKEQSTTDKLGSIGGNGLKGVLAGAAIGTALGGPVVGTVIGAGIGLLLGAVGTSMEQEKKLSKEEQEKLDLIQKNTYTTAQNTSYQGIGMVYRYRGTSNYSSAVGSATSRATNAMGDLKYEVGSRYGPRPPFQTSDGEWTYPFHSGNDFPAPEGTPLYSNVTGRVVFAGQLDGGANCIAVRDKDGYTHWYAHMQKPTPLTVGSTVNQGDFVGYVGQTGHATGPHLHYAVTTPGSGLNLGEGYTVDSLPFVTDSIFSGNAATSVIDSNMSASSSGTSPFIQKKTSISASSLGDIARPIVGSINDLKQTIITLSEQTSRNQKIMDALVNRTMQSPTV